MKEKGLRMLNVFQELDKDNSGSVTGAELVSGLLKLKEPSGKLKALIKRKHEGEEQQRIANIAFQKDEAETKAKLKVSKRSERALMKTRAYSG